VVARPAVAADLALVVLGFGAVFIAVGYIGPLLKAVTGFGETGVGSMQAIIGAGGILGTACGGIVADRDASSRVVALVFVCIAVGLFPFSLLLHYATQGSLLSIVGAGLVVLVGSSALFCLNLLQQYRLVQSAPENREAVLALNFSAMFLGQGVGPALGGLVLAVGSLSWLGYAGTLVVLAALALIAFGPVPKAVPFPSAQRTGEEARDAALLEASP